MALEEVVLPNVKKLFIPDPGYVIIECDLAGADAQVVAWEAEDEDLKQAFRDKRDIHAHNAEAMWGTEFTRLDKESKAYYKKRQSCKHAVHGTNYGGSAFAVAHHPSINWTVHEAERFQKRWFEIHPGIKRWHTRTQNQLDTNKTITNALGYRRVFFDRPPECFTEAIAWVPQSTVALVSFHGAIQLERTYPWVEMLLQVHDSVVFQIPKAKATLENMRAIKKALEYPVPYPDPLTIPLGFKMSEVSWGDCVEVKGL